MKHKYIIHGLAKICMVILVCSGYTGLVKAQDPQNTVELDSVEWFKQQSELIAKTDRFIESLNPNNIHALPVGIKKEIGNQDFSVIVTDMRFNKDGGMVQAAIVIEEKKSQKEMVFAGGVGIHPGGFKKEGMLYLAKDFRTTLFKDKADIVLKGSLRNSNNYVKFDCNGYQGLGLDGQIIFDPSFIKPPKDVHDTKVKADFEANIEGQGLNDIIASGNMDPFVMATNDELGEFVFTPKNFVFDFSETISEQSGGLDDYFSDLNYSEDDKLLWTGFFVEKLSITFPEKFSRSDNVKTTAGIHNLVIDDKGLTGAFFVDSIISFEKGNIRGWNFSLDHFELGLKHNQLSSAELDGRLAIPIGDENNKTGFAYTGGINDQGYFFVLELKTAKIIDVPALSSRLTIKPGSNIFIESKNNEFYASTSLNGKIDVESKKDLKLQFSGAEFQGLKIQTEKPYIDVDEFSAGLVTKKSDCNNFPITLNEIYIAKKDDLFGLGVDAKVNLAKDLLSAGGKVTLWGKIDCRPREKVFKYTYEKVSLEEMRIDNNHGGFSLNGFLKLYNNDPDYGDGFEGGLELGFEPGIEISANALFGKKDDFRYFYADALYVNKTTPFVTIAGVAGLYGFGGGLYRHMKPVMNDEPLGDDTPEAGRSLTKYVPDKDVALGVKAKAIYATTVTSMCNGYVGLDVAFNNSFGLYSLGLEGTSRFMQDITSHETPSVYAEGTINYNFDEKNFEAGLNTIINTDFVTGSGNVDIKFSEDDWHIYIGYPEPMNLNFLDFFKTESYFVARKKLPKMPNIDTEILKLTGRSDLCEYTRNSSLLEGTKGFGFGSKFQLNKKFHYVPFYAYLKAMAGFDIFMGDASNIRCAGHGGEIGINGWYAMGQAYAGFQGKVGIKGKFGGFKVDTKIFDVSAAAFCKAELPNPTWIKGEVHGKYNILGGAIKGKCDFPVELGSQCEEVGGELSALKIIQELSPDRGNKINVFTKPQVAFNIPIGQHFDYEVDGVEQTFKVELDYFRTLDNDNIEVLGEKEWSDDKKTLTLKPDMVLPEYTNMKIEAKVSFKVKKNNRWIDAGHAEDEQASFKTGEEPDYIPEDIVVYTYPINKQVNFYKNEYGKGYIQLRVGLNKAFNVPKGWEQKVRFFETNDTKNKIEVPFSLSENKNYLEFTAPETFLKTATEYDMAIMNIPPPKKYKKPDGNVDSITTREIEVKNTYVDVVTKDIKETLQDADEKPIFNLKFRTSQHETFGKKFKKIVMQDVIYPEDYYLYLRGKYTSEELSDKFEISGYAEGDYKIEPLIRQKTDTNIVWIQDYILPEQYRPYYKLRQQITEDVTFNFRDTSIYGFPPYRHIGYHQENKDICLDNYKGQINNKYQSWLDYYLPISVYQDYQAIQEVCCQGYFLGKYELADKISCTGFCDPFRNNSKYNIFMQYVLPGKKHKSDPVSLTIFDCNK